MHSAKCVNEVEYQRSRSFFDLGQRLLRFQSLMFDFGLYTQICDSGPHGPLVSGRGGGGGGGEVGG